MSSHGGINGLGKIRAILIVVSFLASPEGTWKSEAAAIGDGGRIQIQEQDLNPNPFKDFLVQGSQKIGGSGGGISNSRNTSPEWETVLDPKLYIITEYGENSLQTQKANQNEDSLMSETEGGNGSEESGFPRLRRNNNNGHSLSIVNPLDVLRQRLLLEIARRRNLKQNQHQIIANAEILKNIG